MASAKWKKSALPESWRKRHWKFIAAPWKGLLALGRPLTSEILPRCPRAPASSTNSFVENELLCHPERSALSCAPDVFAQRGICFSEFSRTRNDKRKMKNVERGAESVPLHAFPLSFFVPCSRELRNAHPSLGTNIRA